MSETIQPSFRFDANDLSAHESFTSWRDIISVTHDVSVEDDDGFRIWIKVWYLGQMMVTTGQFSAQEFSRHAWRIRHDQIDQYGLFVQGEGLRTSRIGEDEFLLKPGDLQIVDFAQFESSAATNGSSGTLYLPRDLVDEVIPDFSRLHGMVLRDGASRLLAQHILAMGRYLESTPVEARPGLTRATLEMALGCLEGVSTGAVGVTPPYEAALRRKIERFVDRNLGDPALSVDSICAAFKISRSTLYRLFDTYSGVANFIKLRRLLRIRSVLIANVDMRPLAEIAVDFGFASGGHFSREFHRQFGCSPSDFRSGRDATTASPSSPEASLDAMFRMLHP